MAAENSVTRLQQHVVGFTEDVPTSGALLAALGEQDSCGAWLLGRRRERTNSTALRHDRTEDALDRLAGIDRSRSVHRPRTRETRSRLGLSYLATGCLGTGRLRSTQVKQHRCRFGPFWTRRLQLAAESWPTEVALGAIRRALGLEGHSDG